ncbi:MAG: glycosyltransferase [Opitutaceae bacterium]|nr:glycosyltransferase [Opitutaceae bacterium]
MVYFDITKSGSARHRSGLTRVSNRLREEWSGDMTPVSWGRWNREMRPEDWYFTPEVFSAEDRPGWSEWLAGVRCRRAAIYHDAIPLKFPHITWPHSVARHALYMKQLARFDHVFAVSETSRKELHDFWRWQGVRPEGSVTVLALGADGLRCPRPAVKIDPPAPSLLVVGILEPRKNQMLALRLVERLWEEGLRVTLNVVGRVNPHFGSQTLKRIKALQRSAPGLVTFHEAVDDRRLSKLYSQSRLTLFPTLAEGCGLPLLESLWFGVPCICSDLQVLRENSLQGGCVSLPVEDLEAWVQASKRLLTDDAGWLRLADEALRRTLPTWAQAAREIRERCGQGLRATGT